MSKTKEKASTYEEAMHELQDITIRLQAANISMDDLADAVRRANELIRYCRERLRTTEQEIRQLTEETETPGEEGINPL
ncbi:MAG: Exonuclease small subunit [Bacteroidota bacterium]|jgi:exodeoxyribonuclease VII small subunit